MYRIPAIAALLVTLPSVAGGQPVESGTSLSRDIAGDYVEFFSAPETYLILGVGLGASGAVMPADERIAGSRFNGELPWGSRGLARSLEAGEILGGSYVQLGSAFAAYGFGRLAPRSEFSRLGRDLVRAQVLTAGMTQLLKYTVRRERPDGSSRASFPSGHSSGTFATATVFHRRYGWKAGIPAYGLAAYVAASRLNENKHYLSDVIFGAAIGIAAGRTVVFKRGRATLHVAPAALRGGPGVQMAIVGW